MINGTAWTEVKVWHDEDEPTIYRVLVQYEYEMGGWDEGYRVESHAEIEVIEYPEGISQQTKEMIDDKLSDVLDEILSDGNISEWDFDDYWQQDKA